MATRKKARTALYQAPDWADTLAVRAVRFGDSIAARMTAVLAPFGVTPLQYNVLRSLYVRDEAGEGLPVGVVGSALVAHAPDLTRLVDRLEKLGHLARVRKADDRRVVRVKLTDAGLALVEKIHRPLSAHQHALFGKLSKAELKRFAEELGKVLEKLPS
jgi:MarR family transcriptional regulator, organic hydroperoxide resistance regulator